MLEVLDPIGHVEVQAGPVRSARPIATLDGKVLGLLCNGKPNAAEMLKAVERQLSQSVDLARVLFVNKYDEGFIPHAAPDWLLDRLTEADLVIHGCGD